MSPFWRQRLTELAILAAVAVVFTCALAILQLIVYGHVNW